MNKNIDCPITNSAEIGQFDTPTFYQVLVYWKEKSYKSSPADFFLKYNQQDWKVGDEPIRHWKKLADYWEGCQF